MIQEALKVPEAREDEQVVPALLDKASVCQRLGIAPRTLENMVSEGEFPPSVKLGKYVYWSEKAILKWLQLRFAAQESWRP
ncbi:MAG: hypothetical protein ABS92_02590 [Thiobacillus sp. SCN 63-374]|nr:MAG: hypothetical protein ABS92_02590 [Thiobacillus sp. SCN 63-374]